ncbi:MAG: glutamine synthetase family protein [Pseudomonadota bacterium]
MNELSKINAWLAKRGIDYIETVVADMAGIARGKLLPLTQLEPKNFKLPVAVFCQTIDGSYYMPEDNAEDRDMLMRPDPETLRPMPWAKEPTAAVIMDCVSASGAPVPTCPRQVLKRVLGKFEERGWFPVVAPELEFYLTKPPPSAEAEEADKILEPPAATEPYGLERTHDIADFTQTLSEHCHAQSIPIGAVLQELGPGQFEVNLEHGNPLKLADDVFHFKRTVKRAALAYGMNATFVAKLDPEEPGSSMHIHQSVYDAGGGNVFSDESGSANALFEGFIGGLQTYLPEALLLLAPYANSYRRFINYWSSPVNLEWGVDNRTTGLRVPESPAQARRVENRLPGSDVNPYLAFAASLACGFIGMRDGLKARPEVDGSAYKAPFALHRHVYEALDALRGSDAMVEMLGSEFVETFAAVKEREHRSFQERIPQWERDELQVAL